MSEKPTEHADVSSHFLKQYRRRYEQKLAQLQPLFTLETERLGQRLLVLSLFVATILLVGAIPSEIQYLGLKFDEVKQNWLICVLGFSILYNLFRYLPRLFSDCAVRRLKIRYMDTAQALSSEVLRKELSIGERASSPEEIKRRVDQGEIYKQARDHLDSKLWSISKHSNRFCSIFESLLATIVSVCAVALAIDHLLSSLRT